MSKEIRLINLLVATILDKASFENEKYVSQIKVVKLCKKLMASAGHDTKTIKNMHASGAMRLLFEKKSVTFNNKREQESIDVITHVLKFHKVSYRVESGRSDWATKIII